MVLATLAIAVAVVPAAASNGFSPSHGHMGGIVPAHSVAPQPACPVSGCGSGDLHWNGGPVMHTNKTYAIYWAPSGYSFPSGYQTLINQYFTDVAADSGGTQNDYGIDTQYYDGGGNIQYSSTFGSSVSDTHSYPSNGCPAYGGFAKCLTDAQLQSEIASVVTAQGWPKNGTTMYFLFLPSNVGSCFDGTGSQCAYTYYCAYHDWFNSGGEIIYASQPYAHVSGCSTGQSPNANAADDTINVVSHEHNEAITDPQPNTAWADNLNYEIGDKCAWTFGTKLGGTSGSEYNEIINGDHYYLQEEYDNASHSCLQRPGAGGGSVTVSSLSPNKLGQGASGAKVDIFGSGFTSGATVSISGSGVTATVTSAISGDIVAKFSVAPGAATGARNVTVTVGGSSGTCTGCLTIDPGPVVTSASPSSGSRGTTLNVRVFGSNFAKGAKVKFGNGITINSHSFVNSGEVDANITISSTAATGGRTVTVTNKDKGVGTLANGFTVN
jgi:hypothetical protein